MSPQPRRPAPPTGAPGEGGRLAGRRRLAAVLVLAAIALLVVVAIAAGGGGGDGTTPPWREPTAGAPDASEEAAVEPTRLTIAATGDFLIHGPVFERAQSYGNGGKYDFEPMFDQIKPFIEEADLGICHVETPMGSGPPQGYPVFNTPADLADAIAATGWDVCSTASNHTLDQGQEGVDATIKALDRADLEHAGSAKSKREAEDTPILDVGAVKIAFLAYTEMTNGVPPPEPWSVELAKAPAILEDARRARERGAEAVIVNLHAGDEFQAQPSDTQEKLARKLTRSSDVTAVIGQHVHIVQPIEEVGGKFVVYGEGNLVSNQTEACCPAASQDGLIALLDLVRDERGTRVESVRYVPVYVEHPDFTVLPVGEALEAGEGDPAALRESYERTRDVVGKSARIEPEPARLK